MNEGETFQRLTGNIGPPAISPDGRHIAVELSGPSGPRLVVMGTEPDTMTTREAAARERALESASEGLEPPQRHPMPQRTLATLRPRAGQPHRSPAFLPDGERILVVRNEGVGNGQVRPELFTWNWRTGQVRRVTERAGVREPGPAPDGTWAAAIRCTGGTCDVVRVDLASGEVTMLGRGSIDRPYIGRPAVSPDGSGVVSSVQNGARWRLVWIDADGSGERLIDPDDGATRSDAAFLPGGRDLIVVSTRGGIHNIERIDPGIRQADPLTRVTGAAIAPAPNPVDGSVFFLSLHSRGWDLRRIHADSTAPGTAVPIDAALAPAAPRPFEDVAPFSSGPVADPRAYGLGPRAFSWFPTMTLAQEGKAVGLSIAYADIVGRLSLNFDALWGSASVWRGVGLRAQWRGTRPWIHGSAFATEQDLERQNDQAFGVDYIGGMAGLELHHGAPSSVHRVRLGGSAGRIGLADANDGTRALGLVSYELSRRQNFGSRVVRLALRAHASLGSTLHRDWHRATVMAELSLDGALTGSALYGLVDSGAPGFEQFTIGGFAPTILDRDLVSQRLAMPVFPTSMLVGERAAVVRVDAGDGPVRPYLWAGTTDRELRDWHRVLGVQANVRIPSTPLVPLAGFDFLAGAGYSFDSPLKGRVRAYLGITVPR